MADTQLGLEENLKKFFGFGQFRGLQKKVITSLLNKEDCFVIMPTGGGKSLCYQLPALMQEGTAIVVSPLIALMKNQVDAIRGISDHDGVAHVLNSSLSKGDIQQVKDDISSGMTKLLYVAPESLTKEEYVDFLKGQKISFLAVDEAHCISEWGHDFRPEYRNLRRIIDRIGAAIPIIGLTATATPKVQEDILKNLQITDATTFQASFNRPNLYYEVRPKTETVDADITRFIKQNDGKSGIVYCLSRKRVEALAQVLQVNGIKAVPYHAGLDAKTRVLHQDMFLMEDTNVVVATIAFGMGIDKPDVRFVIHHDIPKSIESYYQETGRAGRDGGEGHCLAYYAYKDIEKLEKFMSGKPIAEQEIGHALLQEMVGYSETSMSRRQYILHYFGEEFDPATGAGGNMDDNMRNPKPQKQAVDEVKLLIQLIGAAGERYKSKDIVNILMGKNNAMISSHKLDQHDYFGSGKYKEHAFWTALIRQVLVARLIKKDIETYGTLKVLDAGREYVMSGKTFMMSDDHTYYQSSDQIVGAARGGAVDTQLVTFLKDLRKKVAKQKNVPPYVVFQDPSLDDMATKYPMNMEEMANIHGVGEGKAKKYGKSFVELISSYVDDNDIIRPDDLIIKSTGAKSGNKLYFITSIDRKLSFDDMASAKGMDMNKLIGELESIVYSGTKLNVGYWIDEMLDEEQQEELHEYFIESVSDKIEVAVEEFEGDYEEEEIRLYRLKFISEVAN
ncbi:MAG: ATP-dependent DNA helicase RecQ [Nonlabens sp.]|jgi:ATP-dependent DNA helicase RecQ|uniref:DNA helicase RecQ n=3 Tax=Nonlabens sp. TaxID=1888209 RepID=UPI0039E6F763